MRQKKSVNGKGNVIMNQNRREGDNIKKKKRRKNPDTLSAGAHGAAAGRRWILRLSPGSIEEGGRGGAAAKYEPLQWFPRAKTHFSHTVRDVVEGETCPNSVYTPVRLSLTEIFLLYVLQTAGSHMRTAGKAAKQTQLRLFRDISQLKGGHGAGGRGSQVKMAFWFPTTSPR